MGWLVVLWMVFVIAPPRKPTPPERLLQRYYLDGLDPAFRQRFEALLYALLASLPASHGLVLTSGARTAATQRRLYDAGRTLADGVNRKSYHQLGQAGDVQVTRSGRPIRHGVGDADADAVYRRLADLGAGLGLRVRLTQTTRAGAVVPKDHAHVEPSAPGAVIA